MSDKNFHVGHFFLERMRRRNPDQVCLIDAATNKKLTVSEVLTSSIRLARSLANVGLKPGDVLALAGDNHVHLRIPYYAGLMAGLPIVGVDPHFKYHEVKTLLKMTNAKIAFCDTAKRETYFQAAKDLGLELIIVVFDSHEMADFIEKYDNNDPTDNYEPAQFEPDSTIAWLVSTSGSTGVPKVAVYMHRGLPHMVTHWLTSIGHADTPEVFRLNNTIILLSPVQWISAYGLSLGALVLGGCLVQTSQPDRGVEHIIDIINEYKPTTTTTSPSMLSLILKSDKPCDLTCFNFLSLGGAKVHKEVLVQLKSRMRADAQIAEMYGQTESGYLVFRPDSDTPIGSCGRPQDFYTVKLSDPDTGKEISEPHKPGELWIKGPHFHEYYKQPEETAKAFSEDGWLKTGDLFYKDEEGYYYFFERLKLLIKYRNFTIAPPELEEVILTHRGVKEVAVTSIPHEVDGQHPVACVVRQPGSDVTEHEIMDLVASYLTESKQLRGGVIFMDIPKTSTGKIARKTLEHLVLQLRNG